MSPTDSSQFSEQLKVDLNNLYREEQFTDLKVASLRRLTPIKPDGSADLARKVLFLGQTHVMTRAGPVPVEFELEAANLDEAAQKFPQAVQKAVDDMIAEAQAMQRERSSSIILPTGPLPGGLTGPGGGKIQMP